MINQEVSDIIEHCTSVLAAAMALMLGGSQEAERAFRDFERRIAKEVQRVEEDHG